jgi:tRNA U34 5-methylaminomethyl-2-thiouridine-forming methyltransferase MnmC
LQNGEWSVRSLTHGETFHPVVGPMAEAEALYVKQFALRERLAKEGELVVWDVGLGAAANPIAVLDSLRGVAGSVNIVSFDHTMEPLRFALAHQEKLGYLDRYKKVLSTLIEKHEALAELDDGKKLSWRVILHDFPVFLQSGAPSLPKPHIILFDAFSPAKNPAMWTYSVFEGIYKLLDPARPCAMPTYSRSTMLRVTLLLAGFFVGVGHATGEKEETTIAANAPELIEEPLDNRWLQRARVSKSAEPLWEPIYRQAHLTDESWERLQQHRQFR